MRASIQEAFLRKSTNAGVSTIESGHSTEVATPEEDLDVAMDPVNDDVHPRPWIRRCPTRNRHPKVMDIMMEGEPEPDSRISHATPAPGHSGSHGDSPPEVTSTLTSQLMDHGPNRPGADRFKPSPAMRGISSRHGSRVPTGLKIAALEERITTNIGLTNGIVKQIPGKTPMAMARKNKIKSMI